MACMRWPFMGSVSELCVLALFLEPTELVEGCLELVEGFRVSKCLTKAACQMPDERVVEEQHSEWFKDDSHFRHLVVKHIKPIDKVLGRTSPLFSS